MTHASSPSSGRGTTWCHIWRSPATSDNGQQEGLRFGIGLHVPIPSGAAYHRLYQVSDSDGIGPSQIRGRGLRRGEYSSYYPSGLTPPLSRDERA